MAEGLTINHRTGIQYGPRWWLRAELTKGGYARLIKVDIGVSRTVVPAQRLSRVAWDFDLTRLDPGIYEFLVWAPENMPHPNGIVVEIGPAGKILKISPWYVNIRDTNVREFIATKDVVVPATTSEPAPQEAVRFSLLEVTDPPPLTQTEESDGARRFSLLEID